MGMIRYQGVPNEKEEKAHEPLLAFLDVADSAPRVPTGKTGEVSRTQRSDGRPKCQQSDSMLDDLPACLNLLDSISIFQLENEFIRTTISFGNTHESIQLPGEKQNKTSQQGFIN